MMARANTSKAARTKTRRTTTRMRTKMTTAARRLKHHRRRRRRRLAAMNLHRRRPRRKKRTNAQTLRAGQAISTSGSSRGSSRFSSSRSLDYSSTSEAGLSRFRSMLLRQRDKMSSRTRSQRLRRSRAGAMTASRQISGRRPSSRPVFRVSISAWQIRTTTRPAKLSVSSIQPCPPVTSAVSSSSLA